MCCFGGFYCVRVFAGCVLVSCVVGMLSCFHTCSVSPACFLSRNHTPRYCWCLPVLPLPSSCCCCNQPTTKPTGVHHPGAQAQAAASHPLVCLASLPPQTTWAGSWEQHPPRSMGCTAPALCMLAAGAAAASGAASWAALHALAAALDPAHTQVCFCVLFVCEGEGVGAVWES